MDAKCINAFIKCCDAVIHAVSNLRDELMAQHASPDAPVDTSIVKKSALVVKHAVVKCAHCGKEFERQRVTQKYCSAKCRLSEMKASKSAGGEDAVGEKHVCEHCGHEFISNSPTVQYCSRRCKEQAQKKRKRELEKRICQTCGKEFTPKQERSRFCCRSCQMDWHNYQAFARKHPEITFEVWKNTTFKHGRGHKIVIQSRTCQFCGRTYYPTTEEQKYCSKACSANAHEKDKQERLKAAAASTTAKEETPKPTIVQGPTKDDPRTWETRTCGVCHGTFQAARGTNVRYCSRCLGHFGYQECVEIEKEEKLKKEQEINKSPYKVCSICGTYFTDTTPTKSQIFCERCRNRQINKGKKRKK